LKHRYLLSIISIIAVLTACLLCGCTNTPAGDRAQKNITVVSILPQAEFVEKIGGDKVSVVVMIPPGASPATYEPTASQLAQVSDAKLYFAVGSGIPFEEVWLEKVTDANRNMKVVNTSAGVSFIDKDPHVWLSPKQVIVQVRNIYQALADMDPANKDYYYQNMISYIAELESVDVYITSTVSKMDDKVFMVFHPAWGYYSRDYGLNMMPVEIEGKDPSASDLQKLIGDAREKGIKVVFVQPQFSTASAETIAREIGGRVVPVDPLARDYVSNMRNVTETFAKSTEAT
jgi:zinc transport system substrate-binding protein